MTFLPQCLDRRPATYVPGTGYACGPERGPLVDAGALSELMKRGRCSYARCPWLIQEGPLGADAAVVDPTTPPTSRPIPPWVPVVVVGGVAIMGLLLYQRAKLITTVAQKQGAGGVLALEGGETLLDLFLPRGRRSGWR